MNLIEHVIEFHSPSGIFLTSLTDGGYVGMSYTLRVNEPGVLELVLPPDFNYALIPIDGQIEMYRAYMGGILRLEGETRWFIRKRERFTDENGVRAIHLTAYSALHILQRRIVAYDAGTSYTDKVLIPWDDMMHEIIDENYGALASDTNRNLTPWFVVEGDHHWGPSYTHSMPWRIILNVMQDICNAIRSQGIYASFDVIITPGGVFEFRVFVGARGADHSSDAPIPVIVSEEAQNLASPAVVEDWEEEHNYIYATGQGLGDDVDVETAQDDARIGISPFNRQEFNQDSRQVELPDALQSEADASLEENRPKKKFTGTILQTAGTLYGVHWGLGRYCHGGI